MSSPKELILEKKIEKLLDPSEKIIAHFLFHDQQINCLHDYANIVSIKRLGYNDHGPVHMRKVVLNALVMANLLHRAEIQLSLEKDEVCTFHDCRIGLMIAGFLHDVGMSIGRENHQLTGVVLAAPIIQRILEKFYGDDLYKQVVLKSVIIECIIGHMADFSINSMEAGIILVADGCDMEKGRARIPMLLNTESKVGDIHKYSAAAIEKVLIEPGDSLPIKITVRMTASVGFFQVEEVLLKKIDSSPIKNYIELYAGVIGREIKCYL